VASELICEAGRRIRKLRQEKGWSLVRLGKEAGLGPSYIDTIERAKKSIGIDNLFKVAAALGVKPGQLLVGVSCALRLTTTHTKIAGLSGTLSRTVAVIASREPDVPRDVPGTAARSGHFPRPHATGSRPRGVSCQNECMASELMLEVGRRIRKLRQEKGWPQERLREETGLGTLYIGDVERGVHSIGIDNLYKVAAALGVKPRELLDGA
jgi:transcriptional regulator with XRE-family HTH domain